MNDVDSEFANFLRINTVTCQLSVNGQVLREFEMQECFLKKGKKVSVKINDKNTL